MANNLGVFVAVEQKQNASEEDSTSAAANVGITLGILGAFALVGVGILIGFYLWEYNGGLLHAQKTTPNNISEQTNDLFGNTAKSNTASEWTTYTDASFTIQHPKSWQVTKGFSSKSDIIFYDPTSIQSSVQNGQESRVPTVFVDILSLSQASQSAAMLVQELGKQNNTQIQMQQSPDYQADMVLYDTKAKNKNLAWTQNNVLILFSTSLQQFSPDSVEYKIIKSFKLTTPTNTNNSQQVLPPKPAT